MAWVARVLSICEVVLELAEGKLTRGGVVDVRDKKLDYGGGCLNVGVGGDITLLL